MNTYSNHLCTVATLGYDLDGGGYAFEPHPAFSASDVVTWEDPDLDYFPAGERARYEIRGECSLLAFAPYNYKYEFPDTFTDSEGDLWRLASEGRLFTTDHECNCHGEPDEDESGWTFTGDTDDEPHPNCYRCDGDGYVESPGGNYAVYIMQDTDD